MEQTVKANMKALENLIDSAWSKVPNDPQTIQFKKFMKYLDKQRAVEGLKFIYNAKNFLRSSNKNREKTEDDDVVQAQAIYDTFIAPASAWQINLCGENAEALRRNQRDPDQFAVSLIDAVKEILLLLTNGPFREWCNSLQENSNTLVQEVAPASTEAAICQEEKRVSHGVTQSVQQATKEKNVVAPRTCLPHKDVLRGTHWVVGGWMLLLLILVLSSVHDKAVYAYWSIVLDSMMQWMTLTLCGRGQAYSLILFGTASCLSCIRQQPLDTHPYPALLQRQHKITTGFLCLTATISALVPTIRLVTFSGPLTWQWSLPWLVLTLSLWILLLVPCNIMDRPPPRVVPTS